MFIHLMLGAFAFGDNGASDITESHRRQHGVATGQEGEHLG